MSVDENVKFVLDGYARFNAGERVPGLWFFTPDAEYHAAREDPDHAIHRGIDAVRQQFARWVESYPDLTVEPLEAKGNGDKVFLQTDRKTENWVQAVRESGRGVSATAISRSSAAGKAPAASERAPSTLQARNSPPSARAAVVATRLPVVQRRRSSAHMSKLNRSGCAVIARLHGPPYSSSVSPSNAGTAATQTRRPTP